MRVWIENPFDNLPTEGFRPQRFWLMAQAFAAAGHDVTLWTSDFNHTTKKKRVAAVDAHPAFSLVMLTSIPYASNVSLRRMYSHWRYASAWQKAALRHAKDHGAPDVVIVSSPPLSTGIAARRLCAKFHSRLVIDVMDAWPETFERIAPRFALAPLRSIARANYLAADLITTVADAYLQLVRSYGFSGPARRFYHGIAQAGSALPRPPRNSRHVRLCYIGNLGVTYDLATVVKALEFLPNATLAVAGRGTQESAIRSAAAASERIVFHGYLGGDEMNALLRGCDIGIVPMRPESCVGVPYKFADYSRAGLAIASSLGGESSALLRKYKAGESYRPGDPQDLANTIEKISAKIEGYSAGATRLANSEFSATTIYREYVALIESLNAAPHPV